MYRISERPDNLIPLIKVVLINRHKITKENRESFQAYKKASSSSPRIEVL